MSGWQRIPRRWQCPGNSICTFTVTCPRGLVVMGGGVSSGGWGAFAPTVIQSYPDTDRSWLIILDNNEPFATIDVDVWAICVRRT